MRLHLLDYIAAAATVALILFPAPVVADLHLGVHAQDITPQKLPVNVSGDFYNRTADRINRPLYARSFVLDDGKMKIVLCVIDSDNLFNLEGRMDEVAVYG